MHKAFLFIQRRFFLCLWSYFQLFDGFGAWFLLRLALYLKLIETTIDLCEIVVFNVASFVCTPPSEQCETHSTLALVFHPLLFYILAHCSKISF